MLACAISTPVIKQALTDILPYGVRPKEPDCIGDLDFHDARTAQAPDARGGASMTDCH
jgi:hypothetical protein